MSPDPEDQLDDNALMSVVADEFTEAPELANPAWILLNDHFGTDPAKMHIATDTYLPIVTVHLQNAIEKFLEAPGRKSELHGMALPVSYVWEQVSISKLISPPTLSWPGASLSSPDYVQEHTSSGHRTVLRRGLYLIKDAEGPLALWVSKAVVDVMAPTEKRARAVVDELRAMSYELNPFKGQVITITVDCPGNVVPVYLERPREVTAEEVILPPGLLEAIEEHALGLSAAKEEMLEAGHSLKRGILMHGRPGTGKTHTIRYLISKMPEYTVLLMPASRMKLMTDRLAEIVPYVTPGIMVFDDVDLIAEDRQQWWTNSNRGPLFSLLELMDGIGHTSDLLFVLTTNVAERLEEAIAARPGRIDQAFEIPPPDRDCRRRLFELYSADIGCDIKDMDKILDRTEGVTGSFIKELVRRSIVVAALYDDGDDGEGDYDDGDDVTIVDAHIHEALDQLLDDDNEMTARLLGAQIADPKPSLAHIAAAIQGR